MANRFSTTLVLIGPPQLLDLQSAPTFLNVAEYIEIHNLDSGNFYTIGYPDGTTYLLPPGRVLRDNSVPSFIISGVGLCLVLATSVPHGTLPSVGDSVYAIGAGNAYLADESTIHLNVPAHTFSVPAAGITGTQLGLQSLVHLGNLGTAAVLIAAGKPSDGDTIVLTAANPAVVKTMTWRNVVVDPTTECLIGANANACATNLASWVLAEVPYCNAAASSAYVDVWTTTPGQSLVLTATVNVGATIFQNNADGADGLKVELFTQTRTITAFDVTRTAFVIPIPCSAILSVVLQFKDAGGNIKPVDCPIVIGTTKVSCPQSGGASHWAAGNVVTIHAVVIP